jgi:hypothetical protein
MDMKKTPWQNPVKRPAKESTMNTEGDFQKFTELMKKIMTVPRQEKPKPASSSRGPVSS